MTLGSLPDSRLRAFMLASSGLPGLDPHRLFPASLPWQVHRGGGIRRQFSLRKIIGGNRLRLRLLVPVASFLLQQLFNAALCPTAPAPGGVLDLVATIIIPLASLAGLSRNWPRSRSVPSSSPRRRSSLGADAVRSFRPFLPGFFSLILSIPYTSQEKKGCPPNWQTAYLCLNFKRGTASSTILQSPRSAPAEAAPGTATEWFPCWFHT